jgi:hypothetical protein
MVRAVGTAFPAQKFARSGLLNRGPAPESCVGSGRSFYNQSFHGQLFHLEHEAFKVFGLRQVEHDRMVERSATALKQAHTPRSIGGG